jgi:regulator of sigma D
LVDCIDSFADAALADQMEASFNILETVLDVADAFHDCFFRRTVAIEISVFYAFGDITQAVLDFADAFFNVFDTLADAAFTDFLQAAADILDAFLNFADAIFYIYNACKAIAFTKIAHNIIHFSHPLIL